MPSELIKAIEELEKTKGIPKEKVLKVLEDAISIAYRKKFPESGNINVYINPETGEIKIFTRLHVVEKPQGKSEISLKDAQKIKKDAKIDEIIDMEILPEKLGFIAMQVAKQVLIQKIVHLEREALYEQYKDKKGTVIPGKVSRIIGRTVLVKIDDVEGRIPPSFQIKKDRYTKGKELKVYVEDIVKTPKGPDIILSRTSPNLLKLLLEKEIPEIMDGIVEIKGIVREPGERAKVSVHSYKPNVDPVGACIGTKGVRITNISRELSGEKIDIVRWSDVPEEYIKYALSPAKVERVVIKGRRAVVYVSSNQVPLAIGKEGINVKLASKLTGFILELKCPEEES